MAKECDKHPNDVMGLSPYELAKEFGYTNYNYQREFYKALAEDVYPNQAKNDMEKYKRKKLAGGLESLAQSIADSVMNSINYVCKICNPHMEDNF
jgi:hypothetical protein